MCKFNLINGQWCTSDDHAININPSDTSDVVGVYVRATRQQTEYAIESAKAASGSWVNCSPQERADCLERVGIELLLRKDELGRLLAREEGKTLLEAIGEVVRAGHIFKFYAQEALRNEGSYQASIRVGVTVDVRYEPIGVVGVITPWNYPIAIPAWKIAPALAYGNTVVFKPAGLTPASGWELADIISRSGIPDGVFNLVMGNGSVVGDAITHSIDVSAVSFTGSEATGRSIRSVVTNRGGRVQLEMGGKSPLIILDDADLETAIDCAIGGSILSTGQRCTSNTRIIATPHIYDALLKGMVERAKSLTVGNALYETTDIGPVVDERQLKTNLDYINIADKEGGKRLCGGEVLQRDTQGFYLSPAVYSDCTNSMVHVQEEIFGPVVSVMQAMNYDSALEMANDNALGLSAGICTQSLKYAEHFKANSNSGMVMVNLPTAGVDYHVPFGGRKASSYGSREQGRAAREFYTSSKTCYTKA